MGTLSFKCRKFDLQAELEAISSAVDSKSKDQIYSCIYMQRSSKSDLLMAAASRDLIVSTSVKIDAGGGLLVDTEEASSPAMAVEASKLTALVKKLPDKIIEVTYDDRTKKAKIRCDSSSYTLSCQDASLFPAISTKKPEEYSVKLPLRFFHSAITHSLDLIITRESPLVYFSGALLILQDKVFEVIATDGNRMSVSFTTLENTKTIKTILPRKVLAELAGTLAKSQIQSINLEVTPNHAFLNFGKYTYQSGILAGSFPNYKLVTDSVRQNNDLQFQINRSQLLAAVERCLVFVGKKEGCGINLSFKEKELSVETANDQGDSVFEIVEAECAKILEIRINGDFVRQYLTSVPNDETVDLWINGSKEMSPMYFRVLSDRNYLLVAQPMELR